MRPPIHKKGVKIKKEDDHIYPPPEIAKNRQKSTPDFNPGGGGPKCTTSVISHFFVLTDLIEYY